MFRSLFTGSNQGKSALISRNERPARPSTLQSSIIWLSFALLSACTNFGGANTFDSGLFTGGEFGQTFPITITAAVVSSVNQANLDIIGDGTGSISQFCIDDGQGSSTCACNYTYQTQTGATESQETPTLGLEGNQVTCQFQGIVPSGVGTFEVSIHITTTDQFSNTLNLTLTSGGVGGFLDTEDEGTFVNIKRYQCKDIFVAPHPWDGTVYDPFQSESPVNTYPFNFYTQSLGWAALVFVVNTGLTPNNHAFWECDFNPNEPEPWQNMPVFSTAPDSAGSYNIFPPGGSAFDRSTFYLAKQPAGVFNQAINAAIIPSTTGVFVTSTNGGDAASPPPIGFAASTVPTGPGQTGCPTNVEIPEGFQWVKVWNFRSGDIDSRQVIDPLAPTEQIGGSGFVACMLNTQAVGFYQGSGQPAGIFDKCGAGFDFGSGAAGLFTIDNPNSQGLADRILGASNINPTDHAGACLKFPTRDVTDGNPGPAESFRAGQNPNFPGGDLWEVPTDQPFGVTLGPEFYEDIWEFEPVTFENPTGAGAPFVVDPGDQVAPEERIQGAAAGFRGIDPTNRFDLLFVVTPPSVQLGEMTGPDPSPYKPMTFKAANDCDPQFGTDPLSGNCDGLQGKRVKDYSFIEEEVGAASGSGAFYPVCALQPE